MRKLLLALTALAFVVALGAPVLAKVETVKGKLVDQNCYKMDKAAEAREGNEDACAVECAKEGRPVALLTTDGKVYQVTGDLAANKNAKLVAHMTHTVEITGEVSTEHDGTMKIAGMTLKMISK